MMEENHFDSDQHAFFCGQLIGELTRAGYEVEPGTSSDGSYLPGYLVRAYGKTFAVLVSEVASKK